MNYINLSVDRVQSELNNDASKSLAYIDPAVMERYSLKAGDVVKISTTKTLQPIPVRLGNPIAADRDRGTIRIDRFLRQATKAKLNQVVEITEVPLLTELESVTLLPPIDLSTAHHLIEHLKASLIENRVPLGRGSVVYATFHGSSSGTSYRVVQTVKGYGVVGEKTKVNVDIPEISGIKENVNLTFEDVGGLKEEIVLIRELVQLPLQFPQVYRQLGILPPKGIIFYGPPGSGKTYLAKALANEVDAGFYYINGPDIVSTMFGETEANLRKMFAEAAHHAPSVVLIDELDSVAPHRGSTGAQSDVRMVTQLLSLLDGLLQVDGIVVIGTTNRIETIDTALRRPGRFDREVFIGPPSRPARLEILEIHSREMPLSDSAIDFLPKAAAVTHGFVGADIMELCREAGLSCLRRSSSAIKDHLAAFDLHHQEIVVEAADFENALKKIRPSAIREALVSIPEVGWDQIGGLAEVKRQLQEEVEISLRHPELFRKLKMGNSGGILLYGPPGTGKTLLAQAVAKETGVNFLALDGPEIFSKWLGDSEEAVRHIFRVARQLTPSIIFFDQLDALAPARGNDSGTWTTERVVNQLLAEMDGIENSTSVLVIAASNRVDLIDPAVLRPGRFSNHIYVPLPDAQERVEIFRLEFGSDAFSEDDWGQIAERIAEAEGFSGADLHSAAVRAKKFALRNCGLEMNELVYSVADVLAAVDMVRKGKETGQGVLEGFEGSGMLRRILKDDQGPVDLPPVHR